MNNKDILQAIQEAISGAGDEKKSVMDWVGGDKQNQHVLLELAKSIEHLQLSKVAVDHANTVLKKEKVDKKEAIKIVNNMISFAIKGMEREKKTILKNIK